VHIVDLYISALYYETTTQISELNMSQFKKEVSYVLFHMLFEGIYDDSSIVEYIDTWESSMQTPFKESLVIISCVLHYAQSISDAVQLCKELLPKKSKAPQLTLKQQLDILCDEPVLAGSSNFLDDKIDPSLRAIFWSE